MSSAVTWRDIETAEAVAKMGAAWHGCQALAIEKDILACFSSDLKKAGVAGEERPAKLVYLALISRLLDKPVSVVVKGPSAAGKSFLIERVLRFVPPSAYYALSSMSERALAYSEEPLVHRTLVVYEAAGLHGDFAGYLVRSLLSEGRVRYETVEKTAEGLRPRLIEREGPTNLIVTTTAVALHPENETRLITATVSDTPEQTRSILRALAEESESAGVDFERWHALQEWIQFGERRVIIPYARPLADMVPPVATRLRRDFGVILSLIRAHALLHRASRERDQVGRIVATLDDYSAVRDLMDDLVADAVGATVSKAIRETVTVVATILQDGKTEAQVTHVARALKLDKATALRRVRVAIDRGYLQNLEDRRGRPARLVLGDPLPDKATILPDPHDLEGCTVAVVSEGICPSPSIVHDEVVEWTA